MKYYCFLFLLFILSCGKTELDQSQISALSSNKKSCRMYQACVEECKQYKPIYREDEGGWRRYNYCLDRNVKIEQGLFVEDY